MSEENVELVRGAWEAFLRGDIDTALQDVHPDGVAYRAPPLPDPQAYHGTEGVLQMYRDWTAEFEEFEMAISEFTDAGDRVVVEVLQRGRGRASGAEVEGRFWFVYEISDGKIMRQGVFGERRQALEVAGLQS